MSVNFAGLPAATTLTGSEIVPLDQSSVTSKSTVSAFTTYTTTVLAGLSTVSSGLTGDLFPMFRSGTGKTITIDNISAYAISTLTFAGLSSGSAVQGTDYLAIDRSGLKQVLASAMATYVIGVVQTQTGGTPVSGDTFPFFHSSTGYSATIDAITTYVTTNGIAAVSAVTSLLSTDSVFCLASGAAKKITVANLESQIVTDKAGAILSSVASQNAATSLSTSDLYLVSQSGTATYASLSMIETRIFGDFLTYVSGLGEATLAAADKFYCVHSGAPKYAAASDILTYVLDPTLGLWSATTITLSSGNTTNLTGDTFYMYRSGTGPLQTTIDNLTAYVLSGVSQSILNLSTLSATTSINQSDYFLVTQTTTPKSITTPILENRIYLDFANYLSAGTGSYWGSGGAGTPPPHCTALGGTEFFYCVQTTAAYATPADLSTYVWGQSTTAIQALSARGTVAAADIILVLNSAASFAPTQATLGSLKLATNSTTSVATPSTYTALSSTVDVQCIQGSSGNTGYGWILPSGATVGQKITLIETAGYPGKLFPQTGANINGLTTTTDITITANHVYECRYVATNTWYVNDAGLCPAS